MSPLNSKYMCFFTKNANYKKSRNSKIFWRLYL